MNDSQVKAFNDLLHVVQFKLRFDRLYASSELLKDIAPIDLRILRLISANQDIILREVREELEIPQSTLTSAIDRLEKKGLIERFISQRDRRSFVLKLTDEGRRVQDEHDRIDEMVIRRLLEIFETDEERQVFVQGLEKIARRLR